MSHPRHVFQAGSPANMTAKLLGGTVAAVLLVWDGMRTRGVLGGITNLTLAGLVLAGVHRCRRLARLG